VWWCTLVFVALGSLKQGDHEFESSLSKTLSQNKNKTKEKHVLLIKDRGI
jgi:hypothetical protein